MVPPYIRRMIVGENVVRHSDDPLDVSIGRVVGSIDTGVESGYPAYHPELCVYVEYSAARGPGTVRVVIWHADGDQVFGSRTHPVAHGDDPLEVRSVIVRIQNCRFNEPGLYWVDFRYNDEVLVSQPLIVR